MVYFGLLVVSICFCVQIFRLKFRYIYSISTDIDIYSVEGRGYICYECIILGQVLLPNKSTETYSSNRLFLKAVRNTAEINLNLWYNKRVLVPQHYSIVSSLYNSYLLYIMKALWWSSISHEFYLGILEELEPIQLVIIVIQERKWEGRQTEKNK